MDQNPLMRGRLSVPVRATLNIKDWPAMSRMDIGLYVGAVVCSVLTFLCRLYVVFMKLLPKPEGSM